MRGGDRTTEVTIIQRHQRNAEPGHGAPVVLSTCCKEGSTAVTCGTPRRRPTAGQRASPGTVDRFPSSQPSTGASGGPRSGMASGPDPDSGGSPGEWVSRRVGAGGVAGRGVGVKIVQPWGAPAGPLPPDPLRDMLTDATGYPLPAPPVLRHANTLRVPLACH
jgi:hypothetical protein